MRTDLRIFALLGLANAKGLVSRQDTQAADFNGGPSAQAVNGRGPWRPITNSPSFFSLEVDAQQCAAGDADPVNDCPQGNLFVRLTNGEVIVTPYNKFWDPKLPIFFVDDDSKVYTVSKNPLQLYVDSDTGAVKYAPVGWVPPTAITTGFFHTGTNPLGVVNPSSSYLGWPLPNGLLYSLNNAVTPFNLCPLGITGQYQLFVSDANFANTDGATTSAGGVDKQNCLAFNLAALDANPFARSMQRPQTGGAPYNGNGGTGVVVGAGTAGKQ
ncbi:hypothetical protein N0V83_007909 [Neocucurbitaria cava]|uniref:Uncharacterized protein n=1 Tax=Neocucurbitaria cava TaxID=798079 RepID=A0A9W8Y2K3_9PLEO|nr:hypothetical protein N0V83_007909 [Neocucurbitaria cava]